MRKQLALGLVVTIAAALGSVATVQFASVQGTSQHRVTGSDPTDGTDGTVHTVDVVGGGHQTSFVPIAPCRLADTRKSGGQVTGGTSRTFQVTGATNFPAQGGANNGCGIPTWASAVATSVSATGETGFGGVTLYPAGSTVAAGTTLAFTKGVYITSSTVAKLGTSGQVSAYIGGSAKTHLVLDAVGYYQPAMYAVVNSSGTVLASSRLALSVHDSTGDYVLQADSAIGTCAVSVNAWNTYRAEGYGAGQKIYVTVTNAAGTATDAYFQVNVTC